MMKMYDLKERLFEILYEKGAVLAGVADLSETADAGEKTGVSVAVPVPVNIVEDLKTAPTKEYYDMYYTLNGRLNDIVEAGAAFLRQQGYRASANTTEAVKMDENWCTPLPHKTVAALAGLGWIGRSCLLVTKEFGSALRLSSLVTDAPLKAAEPVRESNCGNCSKCVQCCPAGALTGAKWTAGLAREELFDKDICKKTQTKRMKDATGMDADLCGKCFAVCPYTQRYLRREGNGRYTN